VLTNSCHTILDVIQKRAEQHPTREYIKFLTDGDSKEVTLTYKELQEDSIRIASWLLAKGYQKGDTIIILLPNGLEFVQMFYGCLMGGFLPVPLSHQMQAYKDTLVPALQVAQPKMLISTSQVVDFMTNKLPEDLKEYFQNIEVKGVNEILKTQDTNQSMPLIEKHDPAYLQFSSGSTGRPKGVIVGHSNIMANMEQSRISGNWEEGRNTCLWLPLFHDFGLAAGLIGALYNGGTVILLTPMHFILKPLRWLKAISVYNCAYSYAPPFAFDMCLRKMTQEEAKDLDLSCVETIVIGAEPVHYDATKKFNDKFAEFGLSPTAVKPGFGMAETVIMFSMSEGLGALVVDRELLEEEHKLKIIEDETAEEERKYLVNLGPQMQGHKIVVADKDKKPLTDGEVGEVYISGPSVCLGYYKNETATEESFKNQLIGQNEYFLRTGDLGLIYEQNLYFAGRIKDIIIIRGRNYYPQDLEHALTNLDEVEPDSAVAYPIEVAESGQQLGIAVEINLKLLIDQERFKNVLLPEIDSKITATLSKYFQVTPVERLYLKSGTIKKTSSGKIKHKVNQQLFRTDDFKGFVLRVKEENIAEDTGTQSLKKVVLRLFKQSVKVDPVLDQPLINYGVDSMNIISFIDKLEEQLYLSGVDLLDSIEDETTLAQLIELLEEEQVKNCVAF
jgi:acyl-CoA synthetase (AMP-forming)/AMP-acid ligase II/acyl carrier protein